MNEIDLWYEAEDLTEEKDKGLQKIGWELFELQFRAYQEHFEDEEKQKIVDDNTWNIYDDIRNNITFEESLNKHKEKDNGERDYNK